MPFHELRQSDSFYADLDGLRLVAPTIQVTDLLYDRMQRHNRELEFDEPALRDGIIAVETEQPVAICFDSQPKGKESIDPTVSFSWGNFYGDTEPPQARISIKPNISEADAKKGANRKLNEALWLGVTVCDALASGQGDDFEAAMARDRDKVPKKEFFVAILANVATHALVDSTTHVGLAANGLGTGVQLATAVGMLVRRHHRTPNNLDDFLAVRCKDEAKGLASQYRALRQGFF